MKTLRIIFLIFICPLSVNSQNPFDCSYDILEKFESSISNPPDSIIVSMINAFTENCLQNDLEYSRWVNELTFKAFENQYAFNKIITSLDLVEENQYSIFLQQVLLKPIQEDYNYKVILRYIHNMSEMDNSERVTNALQNMNERYTDNLRE